MSYMEKIKKEDVKMPNIYIFADKYRYMRKLTENCDREIGWLALSKPTEDGYIIYDVLMCKQEVSGTTTELDEKGIQDIFEKLMKDGRSDEVNNVRCWCHSHVNMPVKPSKQDNETFEEYYKRCDDYFIRLIMNKKGEISLDAAEYKNGFIYRELPLYMIYEDEKERKIYEKIEELSNEVEKLTRKADEIEEKKQKKIDELAKSEINKYVSDYRYPTAKTNTRTHGTKGTYYSENYDYDTVCEMDMYDMEINNMIKDSQEAEELKIPVCKNSRNVMIGDVFNTNEIYSIAYEMEYDEIINTFKRRRLHGERAFENYTLQDWKNLTAAAEKYVGEYEKYDTGLF